MSSASDDSSDDEYKPQEEESDVPSEAETDYDSDGNKIDKTKTDNTKKRRKKQIDTRRKRKNPNEPAKLEDENSEKHELVEDDEEEKRKSDALYASFLNDTNSSSTYKSGKNDEQDAEGKSNVEPLKKDVEEKPKEKIITKVFDFAGEEVKVTEKVKVTENSPSNSKQQPTKPKFTFGAQRSGGLGSVLSQLGKKGKMSTLEKTKLDWMSYKKDEGIEEELQTHNKGKDG